MIRTLIHSSLIKARKSSNKKQALIKAKERLTFQINETTEMKTEALKL